MSLIKQDVVVVSLVIHTRLDSRGSPRGTKLAVRGPHVTAGVPMVIPQIMIVCSTLT
jgi:hypothetical protein